MNKKSRGFGLYIILLLILLGTSGVLFSQSMQKEYVYSDVVKLFEDEQVRNFSISGDTIGMELKDGSVVKTNIPSLDIFYFDLGDLIKEQRQTGIIEQQIFPAESGGIFMVLLPYIVIIGLFLLFWFFVISKQQGGAGAGGAMNFGKSRAKLVTDDGKKVTFGDVAGADEEKEELQEVVEFLKNPQKFSQMGARIPKGVLLVGPPGTGKTLIARAVAGEAGVPFFSISGSDFVELYVGVGASRVRDLFDNAKKSAPAIVFIDEIDAVGRQRGAGLGGGHDEREQTLNQLLVEMDGFSNNTGVIIIAATNRADILDPALLRPGRFDRQVYVGTPDIKGRLEILKIHSRKKPIESDVALESIAKTTAGFTGADLENLLNEAAILAAKRNKPAIGPSELDEAFLKVIMGSEKKNRVISEKERKITAFHEAGHAVSTRYLPSQDPVHQVSIVPRGRAGGFTLSRPQEDKFYAAKNDMMDEIVTLLGGRVAEKLVLDDISTGASNDLERATQIARAMVTKYGMSDKVGYMVVGSAHDEVFLGRDFATSKNLSEDMASLVDSEVKRILDEAFARCETILTEKMDVLKKTAEVLLEREVIDADEFEALYNGQPLPEKTEVRSILQPEVQISKDQPVQVVPEETKVQEPLKQDEPQDEIPH